MTKFNPDEWNPDIYGNAKFYDWPPYRQVKKFPGFDIFWLMLYGYRRYFLGRINEDRIEFLSRWGVNEPDIAHLKRRNQCPKN